MKVHDRGTMKWVSLMLPEHVEWLKEVYVTKKEKPLLDEQKMHEIDRALKYALHHDVSLEMTYFNYGDHRTIVGRLNKIDQWNGFIILQHDTGEKISLSNIIDVRIVN